MALEKQHSGEVSSRSARRPTRRQFLAEASVAAGGAALTFSSQVAADQIPDTLTVPIRAITRGPKFHWFGYYDKLQFDPAARRVLAQEVDFEHRSPTADDVVSVGIIDLDAGDRWHPLGTSRAWGWQQGCMLQWRPGSDHEVLWNDREEGQFICRILDLNSGRHRTLPLPLYTVSPDGKWGLSVDFARINNMRPGYGYAGVQDRFIDEKAPTQSGIWRVDLATGECQLIVSLAGITELPHQGRSLAEAWNYFNHLLISPGGTRIVFLHRWRENYDPRSRQGGRFHTRMFTADACGNDRFIIDPSGNTSHFIWRDEAHLCAWTQPAGRAAGFYLLEDRTGQVMPIGAGAMTEDGHNTFLPGRQGEWILCDTYPRGVERLQTPYLFHLPSGRRFDLGHFHLPVAYQGEWRCDTHPRSSPDGCWVTIDSPHGGNGRQVYLLDVAEILALA